MKTTFQECVKELQFIKECHIKYHDDYDILYKIEGKLMTIDDTLDYYEKIMKLIIYKNFQKKIAANLANKK